MLYRLEIQSMAANAAWASVIEPRPTALSKLNYGELKRD
jgi:hypothetical protein